jgi:hypothetical protein
MGFLFCFPKLAKEKFTIISEEWVNNEIFLQLLLLFHLTLSFKYVINNWVSFQLVHSSQIQEV